MHTPPPPPKENKREVNNRRRVTQQTGKWGTACKGGKCDGKSPQVRWVLCPTAQKGPSSQEEPLDAEGESGLRESWEREDV